MFWVVDSLMMRKYKMIKSLDDSCGNTAEVVNTDESQVRRVSGDGFILMASSLNVLLSLDRLK